MKNGLVKLSNTIEVQGWPLTVIDDEPRVAATLLGERSGYKDKPGARARRLVKQMVEEGDLCGVAYVRESRTQVTGFGERVVEFDEPYLTEVQAVIFAMHVRTDIGKALRQEIARVFVEARRAVQQAPDLSAVFCILAQQAQQLQALTDILMRQQQSFQLHGLAGNHGAAEIRSQLNTCVDHALMAFQHHERKALSRRIRGRLTTELRSAIGYSGNGSTWAGMTTDQHQRALGKLREMLKRHQQASRDHAASRQLHLSLVTT